MPFVTIRYVEGILGEGAEKAAKKADINSRVVQAICDAAGIDPELVWVTFEPVQNTEWYVGHKSVEQIWAERE